MSETIYLKDLYAPPHFLSQSGFLQRRAFAYLWVEVMLPLTWHKTHNICFLTVLFFVLFQGLVGHYFASFIAQAKWLLCSSGFDAILFQYISRQQGKHLPVRPLQQDLRNSHFWFCLLWAALSALSSNCIWAFSKLKEYEMQKYGNMLCTNNLIENLIENRGRPLHS